MDEDEGMVGGSLLVAFSALFSFVVGAGLSLACLLGKVGEVV